MLYFVVKTWSRTDIYLTREEAELEAGSVDCIYEIEAKNQDEAEDIAVELAADDYDRLVSDLRS